MGNIITPEILPGIIAILSSMIAALGYIAKRNVDAKLAVSETAKVKAQAEAEALRNDSQARLKKTESEAASENSIMTMFQQQVTINKQNADLQTAWLKALQDKEDRDEKNYRHLADTQRDDTRMLLNEIQGGRREIIQVINTIPALVQKTSADLVNGIAMDIASQIVQQMAIQSLSQEFLPFPKSDDPGWEDVTIQAAKEGVVLRKSPQYHDQAKLAAPYGLIHPTPHAARIIRGRIPGFWIVLKKQNGDPPAYGYVEERWVKVTETAAVPA